jgi:hypothetical protein
MLEQGRRRVLFEEAEGEASLEPFLGLPLSNNPSHIAIQEHKIRKNNDHKIEQC